MEYKKHYLKGKNGLLDLIYTVIISTFIALFLTLSGFIKEFFPALVISQSFGLSICLIITLLLLIFKPEKFASFIFIGILGIALGIFTGFHIGQFLVQQFFPSIVLNLQARYFQIIIFAIAFGTAVTYFFYSKSLLEVGADLIEQERIKRLSSDKEILKANLKMLQAQIEPHFLFNTLANILSLIDTEPAKSKSMLIDLIHYLRTSMSRTLPEATTLDQEMNMIRAYLNIYKIRMGEMLRFSIEVPDSLRQRFFPPMLIQPLVENALKHGIEPMVEGGEIMIKAVEEAGFIRIEISDNGRGFLNFKNNGVGIANVRERLKLLHGERGRLMIEENKPNGVKATIEAPSHDLESHNCR